MKRVCISYLVFIFLSGFSIPAGAMSMDILNDQTHVAPGGVYGIYQEIIHRSTPPDQVGSHVCCGEVSVFVPAIEERVNNPNSTGLRELWALNNYRTNPLPTDWVPRIFPARTPLLSAFQKFSQRDGFSIPQFIGRFGLPNRYLTAQWKPGELRWKPEVYRLEEDSPIPSDTPLFGPEFLIYDLPSGHAVALYVPRPLATNFITGIIIDEKGDLLMPNLVDLLPPRKFTAESDGKLTALAANGRNEPIGTWTQNDIVLHITTMKGYTDSIAPRDTIFLPASANYWYPPWAQVNQCEIFCEIVPVIQPVP